METGGPREEGEEKGMHVANHYEGNSGLKAHVTGLNPVQMICYELV